MASSDALVGVAPGGDGPGLALAGRAYEALLRPVRDGNAFEETVERLLSAIKLGIAAPGTRLPPERELAERLSVSRGTLREAVRALQLSGYVVSRRGRYGGTFVSPVLSKLNRGAARRRAGQTSADLEDTLVLREVLEVGAAEQAARNGPDVANADHLNSCLHNCAPTKDVTEYRRFDSRLHMTVAEVAGSPSLTAAVAKIRMRVNAFLDAIPSVERNIRHSEEQQARIVGAIVDGDTERARQAMAEHLSATAALLRGFLS